PPRIFAAREDFRLGGCSAALCHKWTAHVIRFYSACTYGNDPGGQVVFELATSGKSSRNRRISTGHKWFSSGYFTNNQLSNPCSVAPTGWGGCKTRKRNATNSRELHLDYGTGSLLNGGGLVGTTAGSIGTIPAAGVVSAGFAELSAELAIFKISWR